MRLHANAKLTPEGRGLLCRRVCEQGWSMADACTAAGVSVRTGYRWLARWRDEGRAGLVDRPSVAHRLAHATDPARVRAILALRGLRMTGLQIAQALSMAPSTVSGILARHGRGRLAASEPAGPATRYERRHQARGPRPYRRVKGMTPCPARPAVRVPRSQERPLDLRLRTSRERTPPLCTSR